MWSSFNIFLQQGLYHKETPLTIETINFSESLAFENRHLTGAHSISDIKLPWKNAFLVISLCSAAPFYFLTCLIYYFKGW